MPPKLDQDTKSRLCNDLFNWVEQVIEGRERHMRDTWMMALANYEGKEPTKVFPWPGASNVFVPVTRYHTDSVKSRLYNAATTHESMFFIGTEGSGEILPGLSFEKLAQWWQRISDYIQKEEIPLKRDFHQITQLMAQFGDAFVYVPWEQQEITYYDTEEEGEVVDLYARPCLRVIHPKDFYIAPGDTDVQEALKVGFRLELDLFQLEAMHNQGFYDDDVYETLKEYLLKNEGKKDSKYQRLAGSGYFKEWGGYYYTPDEYDKKLNEILGVEDFDPNKLHIIHCFFRADLNEDGIAEEVEAHYHPETKTLAMLKYPDRLHRQRPLIHFQLFSRAGSAYSVGVPELLQNIQKIINTVMRDILDNNKVQNTKMFVAKKGGAVPRDFRAYPGRLVFVDDPATDFIAIDMGTGRQITSMNDVIFLMNQAERVSSINDTSLGEQEKSRTPVGTTNALKAEGAQRLDEVIDLMRVAERTMWFQVMLLYVQNADPEEFHEIAGVDEEEIPLFDAAWMMLDSAAFARAVAITPQVSTSILNRETLRNENVALFGQIDVYHQKLQQLAAGISQATRGSVDPVTGLPVPPDPVIVELLQTQAKALYSLMTKIIDTFEIKDQEHLNPDLASLIAEVQSGAGVPLAQGDDSNRSDQMVQALRSSVQGGATSTPATSGGRPEAGLPRVPGAPAEFAS